jgi:hypothetical protein
MNSSAGFRGRGWKRLPAAALFAAAAALFSPASAQELPSQGLSLEEAVICEAIRDLRPVNPAIAFPIETGRILCFTRFAAIDEETFVLHRWYRKDDWVTEKKLVLKPPQWSTYSSIQLRESDKGPWRVAIVGADGRILSILRFSVTE